MAGTTSPLAFPYPTGTDRVMDGDNAIQALAEKVDDYLAPQGITPVGISSQNGWDVAACRVLRFGPFCVLQLYASKTSWGGSEGIGVLPAGYRPGGAQNIYFEAMMSATGQPSSVYLRPIDGVIVTVLGQSGGGSLIANVPYFVV